MSDSYPPAPPIVLKATGSGREINFQSPGIPTLMLCLTEESQKEAEAIEEMIRGRWARAADLLVVYTIDLRRVPGMFKGMAEGLLEKEYARSCTILPEGATGYDYVIMLPDWKGETAKALDLESRKDKLTVVLLTADGRVVEILSGSDTSKVQEAIERAIAG